jgi:hypothetical protein
MTARNGGQGKTFTINIKKNEIIFQDNKIVKFLIKSKKFGTQVCIIDSDDYNKIKYSCWNLAYSNTVKRFSYVFTKAYNPEGKRISILIHHKILGNKEGLEIDHINGNVFDNRKCNLRFCTHSENSKNRTKFKILQNKKFKGVSLNKNDNIKSWSAQIGYNGKVIFLGTFYSEIEAAQAYNEAALKYHAEYSNLNKIIIPKKYLFKSRGGVHI